MSPWCGRGIASLSKPIPLRLWEARIGHLWVYFDVVEEPERIVRVRAVERRDCERVLIGGEEVELR